MENQVSIGTAIGKIILMGEHAVVYGEPAISIPFTKAKVSTIIYRDRGPTSIECLYYSGRLSAAPKQLSGLIHVIKEVLKEFEELPNDFSINIESTIPPERGMGSSAAVSIATIRGLYSYFDRILTHDTLLKWASISEKIVHGNPSGIDAATISNEKAIYYIRGTPLTPFDFNINAYLVVADTGKKGQTKATVKEVEHYLRSNPEKGKRLIKQLGIKTNIAKNSIEYGDITGLGKAMTRAHTILERLGVSDNTLNLLVRTALANGALGAKLTGGGRGGCMIALASDRTRARYISNELIRNGAQKIWISNLGDDLIE